MRAADFKEAARNPDAAAACVTPFGMMQTAAVGSPDLCIFLFAEGGREEKGGKGNKLSMPFMRKACLEDGPNACYHQTQKFQSKCIKLHRNFPPGGTKPKDSVPRPGENSGRRRIGVFSSMQSSLSLPFSLCFPRAKKNHIFREAERERWRRSRRRHFCSPSFPFERGEIYDTRKLLGETALSPRVLPLRERRI